MRKSITALLNIESPVIQAPMAGVDTPELAIAVSNAGGLGSLACAVLSPDQIRQAWLQMRVASDKPYNLNFFCHDNVPDDPAQQVRWAERLVPFYNELGLSLSDVKNAPARVPFDENFCKLVEELKPPVVSFHFGLPHPDLLARVKQTGAVVLSSATTVAEAAWLEQNGCDAIIAQGSEAGGHRGMFLTDDIATQIGLMALLPQIVAAVSVPVIAAGGIADAQGVRAALDLGADAVQLGTAYLFTPEAKVSPAYRKALHTATADATVLTNIFSGKPARGIRNRLIDAVGPMSADAPTFPHAAKLIAPLRAYAQTSGTPDFMQMWAGQSAALGQEMPAAELTRRLAAACRI